MLENLVRALESAPPETASMLYDEMRQHPEREQHTSSLGKKARKWFRGAAAATAMGTAIAGGINEPVMGQEQSATVQTQGIEQRIQQLEQEVRVNPTADNYVSLSNYYIVSGNLDKGEGAAMKALEIDRTSAGAYNNLGVVAYKRGDFSKAYSVLREGIRSNPGDATLHASLANTYALHGGELIKQKQFSEARPYFQESQKISTKAISLDKNSGAAYAYRGVAEFYLGMFALKVDGNKSTASGLFDRARTDLTKALDLLHSPLQNTLINQSRVYLGKITQLTG